MDRGQASRALDLIADAQRRVARHAPGHDPAPWRWPVLTILACLPLFRFLHPALAGAITAIAVAWLEGWLDPWLGPRLDAASRRLGGRPPLGPARPRPPRAELDDALREPLALAVVAALDRAERLDVAILRDDLALDDADLRRLLAALDAAQYLYIRPDYSGWGRQRTALRTMAILAPRGRARFGRHVAALRRIAAAG